MANIFSTKKKTAKEQLLSPITESTKQSIKPQTAEDIVKRDVVSAGGYIGADGKYIPSTAPKTEITFNPDKTVTYKTKDGVTYNLSPEEYKAILAREGAGSGGGKTTQKVKELEAVQGGALQRADSQIMTQEAAQTPQITEQDILNAVPQENLLEQGTAIGAGVGTGIGAGILAGAKAGSILGTAVAPGVGTAIGAVVGTIVGVGAYFTKISYDKRQDVQQAKKVAAIANKNFGQTIDALNAGIITKDEAMKRWKNDKISLYAAYANLKKDTSTDLDRFLSNGADELAEVMGFIDDLNTIYDKEFALALIQPNPNSIKYNYPMPSTEE
jgi:hypothetical protein